MRQRQLVWGCVRSSRLVRSHAGTRQMIDPVPATAGPIPAEAAARSSQQGNSAGSVTRRVTFLGTGDPLNDERAQASLAVHLAGDETMLLDTSSGTVLLQRLRAAGIAQDSIRHVFVSHRHFDHAGGLAPLLVTLVPIQGAHLTVYAPPETLAALHEILALTIPGVEGWLGDRLRWQALAPGQAVRAGSARVTPFAVTHGLECVGFRVQQAGKTLTLSADTRPCPALVDYATGTDLLIHEAYGLQDVAAEAHRFGHATATDAGVAARAAGARRLVLTHLRSSLYADPGALRDEAARAFDGPITVAADLDVIAV
jgi:ribonuclease BN (tRNA processing enzyme)